MSELDQPRPERVLILDDDVMVGKIILSHVRAIGHEGRFTDDPEEFLRWHSEWRPTRVVVDLVMDKMDGLEVLSELAQAQSQAAVIISSGMGSRVMDAARRLADGKGLTIAGLLPKPYKREDLSALLSQTPAEATAPQQPANAPFPLWTPTEFARAFQEALEEDTIKVAYQPKVSCLDGNVVGYEALARWRHPDHGMVPPDTFVPMAERAGLAGQLTDMVLNDALRWFASIDDADDQRISVNISATELSEPTLDQRLVAACSTQGVSPEKVILELTETSAMEDPELSLHLLTRLRLDGFRLSLDDFGTGYSSMLQLARMPFSELKVDRSFVMNGAESEESMIVVRSIVDLGHALGMQSTAEGVECEEMLDLLHDLGCDFAQGFHIARPMYPEELQEWTGAIAS